jgi:hypothetical protein
MLEARALGSFGMSGRFSFYCEQLWEGFVTPNVAEKIVSHKATETDVGGVCNPN